MEGHVWVLLSHRVPVELPPGQVSMASLLSPRRLSRKA
jgi:hypothetical protein